LFQSVDPPNIALGKPVSMSSVWHPFSAHANEAVDGNRSGNAVLTHYQRNPWIRIDLLTKVLLFIHIFWQKSTVPCEDLE
jgi:hypothetical protein